jgi:hypothetical protein
MVFKNLSETLLKNSAGSAPTPVAKPASVLAIMPKEIGDIALTSYGCCTRYFSKVSGMTNDETSE